MQDVDDDDDNDVDNDDDDNSNYLLKCYLGLEQAHAGKVFISEALPAETAAASGVLIGEYAANRHIIATGGGIAMTRM